MDDRNDAETVTERLDRALNEAVERLRQRSSRFSKAAEAEAAELQRQRRRH